jgi:hypothetical protein
VRVRIGERAPAGGSVKLLCVLKEFQGWEPTEDWNNLAFYVQHGDAIERIAIVGQERWRDLALMFAAADLRKGPVEFFAEHDLIQARAWAVWVTTDATRLLWHSG